mgnify:CR=1 FL=1
MPVGVTTIRPVVPSQLIMLAVFVKANGAVIVRLFVAVQPLASVAEKM